LEELGFITRLVTEADLKETSCGGNSSLTCWEKKGPDLHIKVFERQYDRDRTSQVRPGGIEVTVRVDGRTELLSRWHEKWSGSPETDE
jgi:hypothetical protein